MPNNIDELIKRMNRYEQRRCVKELLTPFATEQEKNLTYYRCVGNKKSVRLVVCNVNFFRRSKNITQFFLFHQMKNLLCFFLIEFDLLQKF